MLIVKYSKKLADLFAFISTGILLGTLVIGFFIKYNSILILGLSTSIITAITSFLYNK